MTGICSGSSSPDCATNYIVPDPDIAGIGVIISFAVGNGLTAVVNIIALFFIKLEDLKMGGFDRAINKALKRLPYFKSLSNRLDDETMAFWLGILEKVILGLSDTQLLTGMAILIAGYVKCSISVYHSSIVSDLAWFASGTHLSTLQVLRTYMSRHPALRRVRVILLLAMGGLLFSLVLYQGNQNWYSSPSKPAQCLFTDTIGSIGGIPATWMVLNMFFIILGYSTSILSLYPEFTKSFPASHIYLQIMRKTGRTCRRVAKALATVPNCARRSPNLKKYRVALTPFILVAELLILGCAFVLGVIWAIMYFFSLMIDSYTVGALFDLAWFAFGINNINADRKTGRNSMNEQDRSTENQWGFGQIVPCLLLLLPFMTAFEIWYEARCEAKEEREKAAREREHSHLSRHSSRVSIPGTPTSTPELRLPSLSREDRIRLAEEDRAFDERLVNILPLPAPAHRRSLSVDSLVSEDERFELRSMRSRSQERLIPGGPIVDAQSRLSVDRVSTSAAKSAEGLNEVVVVSAEDFDVR